LDLILVIYGVSTYDGIEITKQCGANGDSDGDLQYDGGGMLVDLELVVGIPPQNRQGWYLPVIMMVWVTHALTI
jgi:hypothetical protein